MRVSFSGCTCLSRREDYKTINTHSHIQVLIELLLEHFSHLVEGTASLKPRDLGLIHCVMELHLICGAIRVLQYTVYRLQTKYGIELTLNESSVVTRMECVVCIHVPVQG